MLFHITQVHAPEDCPYGSGGSRKFHDSSVSEVTVHGVYGAFMEHTIYMVVEADDFSDAQQVPAAGDEGLLDRDHPGERGAAAELVTSSATSAMCQRADGSPF